MGLCSSTFFATKAGISSQPCFFIFRSRLLLHSAGSGVNRVQIVFSGFSVRLFCFVQAKTLCMYGCMYFLAALVLVVRLVSYLGGL